MTASATEIERFGRIELTLAIDAAYQNPFDPDQIDVRGIFTAPDGRQVTAPGFYWQDYDSVLRAGREALTRRGDAAWKIRFTPHQVGSWTFATVVKTPAGRDERPPQAFDVTPSQRHGFCASASRTQHTCVSTMARPMSLSERMCRGMGRVARTIMRAGSTPCRRTAQTSPAYGWQAGRSASNGSDTGLGDYTERLDRAWHLDRVFELAEEHDIYLMLSLLNHGAFSTTINPEWAQNPYNAALGGPLAEPGEFATNPRARELFKRRLRYIVARWGYSPQLMAWEWWNEVDLTPIAPRSILTPWIREMSAYLQTIDPAAHLRTISYAQGGSDVTATMPEIDFVQRHMYELLIHSLRSQV